jgi:hypothetical protein
LEPTLLYIAAVTVGALANALLHVARRYWHWGVKEPITYGLGVAAVAAGMLFAVPVMGWDAWLRWCGAFVVSGAVVGGLYAYAAVNDALKSARTEGMEYGQKLEGGGK